jgi:hypothetical protein
LECFRSFLECSSDNDEECEVLPEEDSVHDWINLDESDTGTFAASYVSGYLLKGLEWAKECKHCQEYLFLPQGEEPHHLLTVFKEHQINNASLTYASTRAVELVDNLHIRLFNFLDNHGHKSQLESRFKITFLKTYESSFCKIHRPDLLILDKSITFLIFKYIKDKKKTEI